MAWLHYLLLVAAGLLVLWLVAKTDDWLMAREKRKTGIRD